jgi:cell fate (sporulation/competence/biofilm development) regulator YmcA (YheA/YmcA/DUF963 family)
VIDFFATNCKAIDNAISNRDFFKPNERVQITQTTVAISHALSVVCRAFYFGSQTFEKDSGSNIAKIIPFLHRILCLIENTDKFKMAEVTKEKIKDFEEEIDMHAIEEIWKSALDAAHDLIVDVKNRILCSNKEILKKCTFLHPG